MRLLLQTTAAAAIALAALPASAEVKIGSVAGVTGPIAELLAEVVKGRDLAASQINAQGAMFDGAPLTMVLADSACDPKAAVDAANKVVNVDQVTAIVGANCSGATNGMVQAVTIPAGVVSISDSATAPSISTLDDNDLVYRVAASDAYQGVALAELAMSQGYEKIAVSYANDDYNAGLAAAFVEAYEAMGGAVDRETIMRRVAKTRELYETDGLRGELTGARTRERGAATVAFESEEEAPLREILSRLDLARLPNLTYADALRRPGLLG